MTVSRSIEILADLIAYPTVSPVFSEIFQTC